MAEETVPVLRVGSRRPLYAQLEAGVGPDGNVVPLTIGSATITMYDPTGAVVTGYNGKAVDGFTATEDTDPIAWALVDTTGMTTGLYFVRFHVVATPQGGVPCTFEVGFELIIRSNTAY